MMNDLPLDLHPEATRVIHSFSLTGPQSQAAGARGRDIMVTAGAGSGKTRTLVARYVSLLAEGYSPRRVIAITFTEKAAREMRSRVRTALNNLKAQTDTPLERQRWSKLDAQMDAARIGTIHSLCAEILRQHPAEAGVDPLFDVLDEGLSATLRAQTVEDTLAWLVGQTEFAPLLAGFTTSGLRRLLVFLLNQRLETQAALDNLSDANAILHSALHTALTRPALAEPVEGLRAMKTEKCLMPDAGDKLAEQIEGMLELWGAAEQALSEDNLAQAARLLFTARRLKMTGNIGSKSSRAKQLLGDLRNAYDERLHPWLGGGKSTDTPPDPMVEEQFLQSMPLIRAAFAHLFQAYQNTLNQRQALDFDDLESGAANLLQQAELRSFWQNEIDALLVDEFQDTNARQREIVLALRGETTGRLFVVGDARQSIYRFRRADVTVFRSLEQDIVRHGGLVIDLDQTFRAHTALLQASGDLLSSVMGDRPDPERPYYVPYSPLHSDHDAPRSGMQAPHIEFVLGGGEDAASARPPAALALVQRLLELRQNGQIQRWDDVALLFRASTGFPAYEDALEEAGIPFVTVAGQGFYNRPEIRDVLNLLRALADLWDDLAMAGLLRSPAFGMSDAALYRLRCQGETVQSYWIALNSDLTFLPADEQPLARRALDILTKLKPLVDRLPVAELLKQLVDAVDYRAILASAPSSGAASRLWRNLDKLLADAQSSGFVNVRDFLEYLETLREVGAREGEAPADAEGAVRLMTIHKAKGLEFNLVVLADAARQPHTTSAAAFLLPETGLTFKFNQFESAPLLHRLAQFQDKQQTEAEEIRLLYVALTRAKEKLLISGHCTLNKTNWKTDGWLADLLAAGGIDLDQVIDPGGEPVTVVTASSQKLRAWALPLETAPTASAETGEALEWPDSNAAPLYHPLIQPEPDTADLAPNETLHPWRATGNRLFPPAEAVGQMVHHAVQRWQFPGDPTLSILLETTALQSGLADPAQRAEAIRLAEMLLSRLQRHPLWQEIDQAEERHHEVPYARFAVNGRLDTGYIDLLYRTADGWQIVDFKTDSLRSSDERAEAVERYHPQMHRYSQAALDLLREPARVRLCFLDDDGQVGLLETRPLVTLSVACCRNATQQ